MAFVPIAIPLSHSPRKYASSLGEVVHLLDGGSHARGVAAHAVEHREPPSGPELDRHVADLARSLGVGSRLGRRPDPHAQQRERAVYAREQARFAERLRDR